MTPEQAGEADDMLSRASRLTERLAGITGHGEAAGGRVTATWSHADGLAGLTIAPGQSAGSAVELAGYVKEAVNAARADFSAQLRAASTEIAGTAGLDVDTLTNDPSAVLSRVERLGNGFADRLQSLVRELATQQRRGQQAATRLDADAG